MTLFDRKRVRCAACGRESDLDVLVSTSAFGADLDGRPVGLARSTLSLGVQRCEGCGYCGPDLATAPADAASLVATEAYQRLLREPAGARLASSFVGAAFFAERAGRWPAVGELLQCAAWDCDDAGLGDEARALRERAAAAFVEARGRGWAASSEPASTGLLLADLLRRAGHPDEARMHALDGLRCRPGDELKKALLYELSLVEAGDTARRSFRDAEAWAEGETLGERLDEALARARSLPPAQVPSDEALRGQIEALFSDDDERHGWAIASLGAHATAALLPALLDATDKASHVPWGLDRVLSAMQVDDEALLAWLSRGPRAQEAAIQALGLRGSMLIARPLVDWLDRPEAADDPGASVRLWALARLENEALFALLAPWIDSRQTHHRRMAAMLMRSIPCDDARKALVALLDDPEPSVWQQAVVGLPGWPIPQKLTPDERAQALRALFARLYPPGDFAGPVIQTLLWVRGDDRLSPLLGHPDDALRAQAFDALASHALSMREQNLANLLTPGLRDPVPAIRASSLRGLSGLKGALPVEAVLLALDDPERPVRDAAAAAAYEHRDPRLVAPLVKLLEDRGATRWALTMSLGTKPGTLGLLGPLVMSPDADLAEAAVEALAAPFWSDDNADLRDPAALDILQKSLDRPDSAGEPAARLLRHLVADGKVAGERRQAIEQALARRAGV